LKREQAALVGVPGNILRTQKLGAPQVDVTETSRLIMVEIFRGGGGGGGGCVLASFSKPRAGEGKEETRTWTSQNRETGVEGLVSSGGKGRESGRGLVGKWKIAQTQGSSKSVREAGLGKNKVWLKEL